MPGVDIILSAGIYVLGSEAADQAGNGVWLAFVIAAIVTTLTNLAFAELAPIFPGTGTSASYARETLGVRFGFIIGWLDLAASIVGAVAVAIGFGSYFDALFAVSIAPVTIVVLIACGVITYIDVREMISATGLIGRLMLTLFVDDEAFRAGMALPGIGLVASIFSVKYEREAA